MVNELLLQKIYHHAKSNPNKIALKFLEGNFKNSQELTYRQLTEKIDTLATTIFTLNNKEVQQPILLLFESSLDYIVSFLAILHSNNIAVTAYPPRQTRHLQRLLKIVEDSHAKIVLTTAKIKKYCEINHFEFPTAPLICVDELELEKSNLIIPTAAPEDIAFLQYTSGSTGAPKGVVVTQQNIVRNLELSIDYVGMESVNTCVSWLPIFHDMGLIGNTLLPLYAGGTCVFMAPLTFLKKPFFWLQKISEEKCTYTMAPNFSYDLAITSLEQQKSIPELDLSHVNYLINGAEPVKAETIKRVEKVLSAYGLRSGAVRPGYGMAEATLVISVHVDESADSRTLLINKDELALGRAVPDQTGNAIEVVRCGKVASPFTLRIVDPDTNKKLPKRCVGEIWIQGACIAKGYYRNEEKTASIFNAFTANGEGPFLRTGDLAFIDDEGYLIISGRLKDLMIINGRNIYPQDVEKACYTSDSHLIIDGAAAFSIPGEISEECIIVAEVKNHLDAAVYKDILAKIQDNVFQAQDIIPTDIVLIPPKRLLKTSSGKVQRNACKQAYLNEEFSIIARLKQASKDIPKTQTIDFTQSEQDVVSHWLKQWLSINTQIDYNHIDEHRPFSEYGLSSVKLVSMMSELEQYIQQDLDPLMAWEFPNIHALTQRLTNHLQVTSCQPQQTYEPIAVIGMDCRIPCDEQSNLIGIEAFWRFLQTESDSIRPIPQERWDIRQYYDPNPDKKGMMYTTAGSFLADVKRFDAKFFNISPREAEYLDPQQRLALMVTWNALEDAGIVPQQLKDSKTGIYLGISTHDYDALIQKQVPLEELNTYQATGTSFATAAGRIAYFLGTHGPCMAIDTACSSSLVSIHQASRALQDRDCHLAIAGGVNLILSPEGNIIFCKSAMLSPKNRCSTFDAEADGYVRGEGCGIVILKRLADALRDNNKIYAVIHGSSVNQDGASNGLTAPNVGAQIEVMESAIKSANLTPDQITHVEAHGTGTSLGDPIEWEGIRRVYASARKKPLYITSLKTRIGHLEAAAGVAGFIKTVLATQYGQIPGHLHLKQFNPKITQQEGMQVPAQLLPWQEKYRYAGVSSFGFSGTNAHIILGNFNREETATEEKQSRSHYLWVVSARDEETLKHYLQTYCDYSQSLTGCDFAAISQKSLTERTHFSHRAFIVAKNCQDWAQALTTKEWQQGKANEKNKVAWLFTGQGCLEPDVAAVLYHTLPAFAAIIDECCAITEPLLDYKLRDVLLHTPVQVDINHTHFAQPALFVFEYALAKWFLSLGVQPALLLGHSLGEYVAACVAEVMSLREALQLVCLRAQLINTLPDNGAMLAIAASANEVETLLIHFPELTISVKNSAQQTVVSGTKEAIDALQNYCLQQELRCKKIATSHAFHSSLMIPIVDKFYQQAQSIDYKPAKIPIISNVTGVELSHTIDASYWCEHLTKTVEFHKGLQTLAEKNITLVQEIGPKAVLTAQAQDACNFLIVPSIRDPKEPWPSLCESLGILYLKGVDLQWNLLNPLSDVTKYTLPKYPFFGKEYWLPTPKNKPANLSYSWRKNLYKLGWRQLTEKPATGNYQNKELTIISPAISSEAPLLLILRNHYKTINFITPDRFVKPEFLQKINEAEALVYFCNANDDEVETEFNNIGLVTRFLLENTPEKPFVFLNNQPRDAISKTGRASLALLKSIKQEYPVWQVRYLEGDFLNDNPQWVHSLQNTINGHWVLRYENQAYYRRQILPLEPNLLTGNRQVYPENTYLVTGACGGIGQILIETLLELGVKHIVAVGRKKTPAAWSTSIQSFLQKGEAQVHYQQCDVSQSAQVTQLIAEIEHELPPLGVIIHAAGITIDKPWLATSNEEIKAIIAGKALGALHLHLATANHPLKEFICISSISGVLGNQGQAAYAAANAFLDALGEQRKAEGKPSFNLILGPVTKTGLFKNNEEKLTEYLAMQGIEPLDPEIIKLILGAQEKENNIIIAQFNGDINAIEEEGHSAQSTVVESDEENVLESQCVAADILKIVQQILKLTTDELSVSDNWFEAGMDSILAAQVVYKINTKCRGNVVTSKDIFRYSTAEELAQKINSTALSKKTVIAKEIHPNSTPLSLQQQEIWNFLKHCQDYRAYQIPMELAIKGSLDVEEFKNSVKKVGERHDIFQVGFHEVLGQVSQHYHQQAVINLEIGSHYNEKEVSEFLSAPFDLKMPPLIRTKLIKVAEDEYRWLLVFHHLISDGNTVNAFIGEVILDYENQPIESTKQYYQYVNWQWNTIHYQLDTNLRDYWMNSLKGIPLDVPSEYTNHTVENIKKDDRHPERSEGSPLYQEMSHYVRHDLRLWESSLQNIEKKAEVVSSTLPLETLHSAIKPIEQNKLSLSNYLLANLFEILFEQFNREQQGVVVFFSGREDGHFSSVFGDTTNDVIVIARKEDNILKQTKVLQQQLLALMDKQYLRMEMVKDMGYQPPMVSFDFQRSSELDLANTSLKVATVKSGNVQSYLWGDEPRTLSFKVLLGKEALKFSLKYRTDKVSKKNAEALLNRWIAAIEKRSKELRTEDITSISNFYKQDASFLQQNLWQSYQGHPDGLPFYIPICKEVDVNIDIDRLNEAMGICVRKHPALRTYFDDQNVLQLILSKQKEVPPLKIIKTNELYNTIGELLTDPIAINKPPLLKWYLIYHSQSRPVLLIRLHHLICDGISSELFLKELQKAYRHPTAEQPQDETYLECYAASQSDYQAYLEDYNRYWDELRKFSGVQTIKAAKKNYIGGFIYRKISKENSMKIENVCRKNKISKYVFYFYMFSRAIAKTFNNKEVYVSLVKSNRGKLKSDDMIGYYADNIPVVIPVELNVDFASQLQKVQIMILDIIQRFQNPLLLNDIQQGHYIQPEFIFNHYTTLADTPPFYSADYILENIVNQQKQVSLWNYNNPEKLNLMVRSSGKGDLLALIYNHELIELKTADDFLNDILEEITIELRLGNSLGVQGR